MRDVEWEIGKDEKRFLDVQIAPLYHTTGQLVGVTVSFIDVTRYKRLLEDMEHSKRELAAAYEEAQSTKEELETTNEELQSTNEELETMTEELQSTNEELETMNEELQSTNEELETTNEEMTRRTSSLNLSNDFLESVLTSIRFGVVVVDQKLRVQSWNKKSEDLWGLRDSEVHGESLLNLEIGLAVERLEQPLRNCLAGVDDTKDLMLSARNRRGKTILCRVGFSPLITHANGISGAILLVEETNEQTPPP